MLDCSGLIASVLFALVVQVDQPIASLSSTDLVEGLASKSGEPTITDEFRDPKSVKRPDGKFPPGYNQEANSRVQEVREEILRRDMEVLRHLADHLSDKRYSFTRRSGTGVWRNWSVGSVCDELIQAKLTPWFEKYVGPPDVLRDDPPDYCRGVVWGGEGGVPGWLRRNERLSLTDLQAQAIDWTLARIQDPRSEPVNKRRIELLEKLRREIKGSGKPMRVECVPVIPR